MQVQSYRRFNQSARRTRRGTTLVETVVMVLVSSIMLALAVTTIHLLLRAERHSTQAVFRRTTLSRLSRMLRDDVHAAFDAQRQPADDDQPHRLELRLSNGARITYQVREHQVTRVRIVEGEQMHREDFYLSAGSTAEFTVSDGSPAAVRLTVGSPNPVIAAGTVPEQDRTRRVLEIEATLGRNDRMGDVE